MGYLYGDGTRRQALTRPIPAGAAVLRYTAAVLRYTKNVYMVFPTTSDITYTTTAPIPITRLYSGYGPYGWIPSAADYSTASNGQLVIQYPAEALTNTAASLLTIENAKNSQLLPGNLGYLPFLTQGQGFYVEIAVTLSENNSDNWFAFFLMPQEHNTIQGRCDWLRALDRVGRQRERPRHRQRRGLSRQRRQAHWIRQQRGGLLDMAKRMRCSKCGQRGCEAKPVPLTTPRGWKITRWRGVMDSTENSDRCKGGFRAGDAGNWRPA